MHEMSLAQSIVEIVENTAQQNQASSVVAVKLIMNLMSNHLSRYSVCKRYAKICGCAFERKTAQLPKMSFAIVKNAMRVQDELHNLPIWVMSFC